jgi:hypothetical protein
LSGRLVLTTRAEPDGLPDSEAMVPQGPGQYLWKSEKPSLHTQGGTMSRLIRASSASRSAKARRVLRVVRKSCTQARLTDRELMAMRTNLSKHAGWGRCGPA